MRLKWSGVLASLGFVLQLVCSPVIATAQGVAMVTDVSGKATVAGQGVTLLSEIPLDTRIDLGAGARLVAVYLQAGDEYVLSGPGQVHFRSAEPQAVNGAKLQKRPSPLGRGVVVKPINVTQAGFVMRGGRNSVRIRLLSLTGTRTLDTQPVFRWQEVELGLKYQFELTDDTGKSLLQTAVQGNSFTLPVAVQLRPGASYVWELAARLADGRRYVSMGDFSVATADIRARAESIRPAADAPVSQRVAFAAWLEEMELRDEARKYWKALATERPEDERLRKLARE